VNRTNVKGAFNSFFSDLKGAERLCEPTVLEIGGSVCFKDDELFHHISKAEPVDPT